MASNIVTWERGAGGSWDKRIVYIRLSNLFESTGTYPSEGWPSERYGHISPAIWDIEFLKALNIYSEMFYGEIPECGEGGKYLESFSFNNTNISSIPLDLFTLPNIHHISGPDNKNLKHLPKGIEDVPFKDNLKCSFTRSGLTGEAPVGLHLRSWLDENDYTSVDWDSFNQINILDRLRDTKTISWFQGNKICGEIPEDVLAEPLKMIYLVHITYPQQEGYGFDNMPSVAELFAMKQAYIEEHPELAELLKHFQPIDSDHLFPR